MPAHTRADEVRRRRLSNSALLTTANRCGNAEADRFAKAAAIRAALLGGWVSVLITDEEVAESLISP